MFNLTPYLEDIERRIDEREEQSIYDAWLSFANGTNSQTPFCPPVRTPHGDDTALDWKKINVNDALADEDLMILSQLYRCHVMLSERSSTQMIMRANYGVGNISRMFGAKPFLMPYETNTLPNVYPIEGGAEGIRRLLDENEPDINAGHNRSIWSVAERFAEIRTKYPKIGKYVRIDAPDGQGPLDNCELLWGSDLFCDFYDEPELVHELLDRITDTIRRFFEKWHSILPIEDGLTSYFGRLAKGGIVLRNDSAMNLSPDFFDEFSAPYDSRLLQHFGGGIVHFCGRGDHFISNLAKVRGLNAVEMSQPHLNDMQIIFSATIDQGINLFCPRGDYPLEGHCAARFNPYRRNYF